MGFVLPVFRVGGRKNLILVFLSVNMVCMGLYLVDFKLVKRSNTYNAVVGMLKTVCQYCKE